jgi:hypothetical protein
MQNAKKNKKWNTDIDRMHQALRKEGIETPIMELFSKKRVNGMAERLGIIPGMSLDLTGNDPIGGMPWDFNKKDKRNRAMDMVLGKQALLIIGSPMCKAFSKLQDMNYRRMSPEKRDEMMKEEIT